MARTAPDWSLLIRAPANLASPGGYSLYEGIVETDRWFGPLFTNLRLTQTHKPVYPRAPTSHLFRCSRYHVKPMLMRP